MTNDNKINDVLGNILNEAEIKNTELRKKERELWEESVKNKYENLKRKKEEENYVKSIDLNPNNCEAHIEKAIRDNEEYLIQAKNAMVFINDDFKQAIPFFGKNLILLAAKTGKGKSTTVANIAYQSLLRGKRVLVITNEEAVSDVYNRVTCLFKGWAYVNHDQFTDEQRHTFGEYIRLLSTRMTVIDDSFNGSTGQTTTLEGITALLESLIIKQNKFDTILIDYYQKASRSIKNPDLDEYKVQAKLAYYLDGFKNRYLAPIVLFAQLKTEDDKKTSFQEAIGGRKVILDVATCAVKIITDTENLKTEWKIEKSRFSSSNGKSIFTGFDRGKFVQYTNEFRNKTELRKQEIESRELLSKVFKPNENK